MKNDQAAFWVIVSVLIALGGFITATIWLLQQWWFVPAVIGIVVLGGVSLWVKYAR